MHLQKIFYKDFLIILYETSKFKAILCILLYIDQYKFKNIRLNYKGSHNLSYDLCIDETYNIINMIFKSYLNYDSIMLK